MSKAIFYISKSVVFSANENRIFNKKSEQRLTEKEKRLLLVLAQKPGEVVSHKIIAEAVWPERAAAIGLNNILQLVFRLRRKLKILGLNHCVCTIAGKGYALKELTTEEDNNPEPLEPTTTKFLKKKFLSGMIVLAILILLASLFLTNTTYDGTYLKYPIPEILKKFIADDLKEEQNGKTVH